MVGSLGEAPLAAVLVANTPVFIIQLVIFGLQSGSSVLISQFWGKGTPIPSTVWWVSASTSRGSHCGGICRSHVPGTGADHGPDDGQ